MPESQIPTAEAFDKPGTSRAAPPNNLDWEKLNTIFEDLPPGIPILPPEDGGNFEKYTHRPQNVYIPGGGWKNCARALEKYDTEICKGYREEIDTLLVFAGLFSAVVTAFTIESYQWLQADANDAIVNLLSQIAQSVSTNGTDASLVPSSAGLPGSVSIRINVYWFLALALSLSAALVAILCKQWIRAFERNTGLTPNEFVEIHHTKLDGFDKWRVGGIISLLPLLLQLALAIFALGVLELLWQLHSAVAIVVCIPSLIAFVFYAATTVLPVVQNVHISYHRSSSYWFKFSECPYKSPQAMLCFVIYFFYRWIMDRIVTTGVFYAVHLLSLARYHLVTGCLARHGRRRPNFRWPHMRLKLDIPTWDRWSRLFNLQRNSSNMENKQPISVYRSLRWIHENLDDGDIKESIWHCLWQTALASNPESGDENHERGFHYLKYGDTVGPREGLHVQALGYLFVADVQPSFMVEVYIQNLNNLDPDGATYLTGRLNSALRPHRLGAKENAAIVRAAIVYGRLHVNKPIGRVLWQLRWLSECISDLSLRRLLFGCTIVMYHTWLGLQPMPHTDTTVMTTRDMVEGTCWALRKDPDDYRAHPERLRLRPGMQELAQLLRLYARSLKDPEATISRGVNGYADQEAVRTIVRELLDMARHSIGRGEAATSVSASSDGALAPSTTGLSPPDASSPTRSIMESPLETRTEEAPHPHTGPGGGRSALTRAEALASHVPAPVDSGGQEDVSPTAASGPSGPQDSSTLHAIVIQTPSGESGQTPPADETDEAVRPTDVERDEAANGGDNETDVHLSQVAHTKGASGGALHDDGPNLRAGLIIATAEDARGAAVRSTDEETVRDTTSADFAPDMRLQKDGGIAGEPNAQAISENDRAVAVRSSDGETEGEASGHDGGTDMPTAEPSKGASAGPDLMRVVHGALSSYTRFLAITRRRVPEVMTVRLRIRLRQRRIERPAETTGLCSARMFVRWGTEGGVDELCWFSQHRFVCRIVAAMSCVHFLPI